MEDGAPHPLAFSLDQVSSWELEQLTQRPEGGVDREVCAHHSGENWEKEGKLHGQRRPQLAPCLRNEDCGQESNEPSLLLWDLLGIFYLQIMAFGKPRNQKRRLRREDTSRCVEKGLLPRVLLC